MQFFLFLLLSLFSTKCQKIDLELTHKIKFFDNISDNSNGNDGQSGSGDSTCVDNNEIAYQNCASKSHCLPCSLSITCGWCMKLDKCVPLNIEENSGLCGEDCKMIVGISKCYLLFTKGRKRMGYNEEKSLIEKPQFTPTPIEINYQYGINNKVFLRNLEKMRQEGANKLFRFKEKTTNSSLPIQNSKNKTDSIEISKIEEAANNIKLALDKILK